MVETSGRFVVAWDARIKDAVLGGDPVEYWSLHAFSVVRTSRGSPLLDLRRIIMIIMM
jgi:hypothetical protein